ncbi:glycosyltransferase family 2 protein [Bradyrhizobium sp. WD16]|uniref:glycosyltransferase family 2 protein n=1 Tax=Bradyrhizobium sp. WD16 TaxID=1521768 RepID=UPI0020A5A476|nr:glycosyltransferase family 2 protein [Bradyrhizobium sp. WD16]
MDLDPGSRSLEADAHEGAALNWRVSGWGAARPFTARFENPSLIDQAIEIARGERGLIEDAIRKGRIPFPSRMPTGRGAAISNVEGPVFAKPASFGYERHAASSSEVLSWLSAAKYNVCNRAQRRGLEAALGEVEQRVPCGIIVVVAEGGTFHVTRQLVRKFPRVVVVQSSYGAGSEPKAASLRRPAADGLFSWLCANADRASSVGAFVLVGDGTFEIDVAAIRDFAQTDIIRVSPIGKSPFWSASRLANGANAGADDASALPRISIVTVSYNQAAYLEQAINSVLGQDYPNLEYVIVDGGSTDGSVEIINRYRDQLHAVVIEPDNGQSDALNKGFRLTSGEILNWLCSDDMLEPGALRQLARSYVRNDMPDLLVGGCVRIGEERGVELARHHTSIVMGETVPMEPLNILQFMRSWQYGNYFFQPEVFFSRRIWDAAGAFIKPHLFYAMDYDLWLRMALAGARVRHIPAFLGCSRVHSAQKTQSDQVYLYQIAQIMDEYEELFVRLKGSIA